MQVQKVATCTVRVVLIPVYRCVRVQIQYWQYTCTVHTSTVGIQKVVMLTLQFVRTVQVQAP